MLVACKVSDAECAIVVEASWSRRVDVLRNAHRDQGVLPVYR
jgi:hypothetical protein